MGALVLVSLLALPAAGGARGDGEAEGSTTPSFLDALEASRLVLDLRLRSEWVEEDAAPSPEGGLRERALANTLRTVLGVHTGSWRGLSLHVAAEDVRAIGAETYDNAGAGDLANGHRDRSVIADPDHTEISQAYLEVAPSERLALRLGRQEIVLGRQRFVGPVGWRQNHQEFDALALRWQPLDPLEIRAGFLDRVHTVTGAEEAMASPWLRGTFEHGWGETAVYGLWLDYDRPGAAELLSSSTLGLRTEGVSDAGGLELSWAMEAAEQRDHGDRSGELDLGYRAAELGITSSSKRLSGTLGWELLEGDGRHGFRTPLATLHKFNGFADRFLVTPPDGLLDLWLSVTGVTRGLSWRVDLHRFEADRGGARFGDEVDGVLTWSGDRGLGVGLKVAHYLAEDFGTDATKVMLWGAWSL